MKNNRQITNEIIETIEYWKHKPEVVKCYLKDQKKVLESLPVCFLIEIESKLK